MNQKRKLLKKAYYTIILLALASCLSPVDVGIRYTGGQIVISGQVSSLDDTSIIQLGRLSSKERLPEPISGALITLFDDQNSFNYQEDIERPGFYVLYNEKGIPGRTYFIEVTLPSGEVYKSKPEKMPNIGAYDTVYYSIANKTYTDGAGVVSQRPFVDIYADISPPALNEPLFFRWNVEETYKFSPTDFPDPFGDVPPSCYITQNADPQRIILFDNEGSRPTKISALLLASRLADYSFHERHYFTIYQSSLTRDAYEYWEKVNSLVNQVGSIFDTPPARIKGNLYNANNPDEEVHGYFQATYQTYHRFFMLPQDLPFTLNRYCQYGADRFYNEYPSTCLDCLRAVNSSYRRPWWF